jgi:hypothetical protein
MTSFAPPIIFWAEVVLFLAVVIGVMVILFELLRLRGGKGGGKTAHDGSVS